MRPDQLSVGLRVGCTEYYCLEFGRPTPWYGKVREWQTSGGAVTKDHIVVVETGPGSELIVPLWALEVID